MLHEGRAATPSSHLGGELVINQRWRFPFAALLAPELGRDDAWQAEQVRRYRELASGYLL